MGIDVQRFVTAGNDTWTKPANAKLVTVYMMGGGQSGDCGGANGAGAGVGGGGSTYAYYFSILADDLGATETVTVGAGGASIPGAAAPAGTPNPGGHSRFGDFYIKGEGETGTYENYYGNINYTNVLNGDGGAGGAATGAGDNGVETGNTADPFIYYACLGGAGGAADANGSDGNDPPVVFLDIFSTSSVDISMRDRYIAHGSGGGGGGGEDSVAPGDGGDGGWPGGGGGGGGEGAVAGSAVGGASGAGGDGVVIVITYTSA